MIPKNFIIEWTQFAPWPQLEQIEQDLIITTALIKLYQHPMMNEKFAFRGGTALHKLYFNPATRYSEDIDLVQTTPEKIGPAISILREIMDPWLGKPTIKQSTDSFKLIYHTKSEIEIPLKIKIEINTREHASILGYKTIALSSNSSWHPGEANIKTYAVEELLATKLRALYQRRKGRDLYDLYLALNKFKNLNINALIKCFNEYTSHTPISKIEFLNNMAEKLKNKEFKEDIRPLIAQQQGKFDAEKAYEIIKDQIINRL